MVAAIMALDHHDAVTRLPLGLGKGGVELGVAFDGERNAHALVAIGRLDDHRIAESMRDIPCHLGRFRDAEFDAWQTKPMDDPVGQALFLHEPHTKKGFVLAD